MKTKITKKEYITIAGLLALGQKAAKEFEACERAYCEIVKLDYEDGESGHFGDGLFGDYSVDTLLKKEGIKVK